MRVTLPGLERRTRRPEGLARDRHRRDAPGDACVGGIDGRDRRDGLHGVAEHQEPTNGFGTLGSTATTGYTDTGLKTGRRHYYRVQSSDAAGNRSAWSPVVTAVAR